MLLIPLPQGVATGLKLSSRLTEEVGTKLGDAALEIIRHLQSWENKHGFSCEHSFSDPQRSVAYLCTTVYAIAIAAQR